MEYQEQIVRKIWTAPEKLNPGAWLWWFWLFFIHDNETQKTGKCRQIMILWSVKNDPDIKCNHLPITGARNIVREKGQTLLDGAAAAWYFDGEQMHDNIVLERSVMPLDSDACALLAPGSTPSSYALDGPEHITKIKTPEIEFTLRAVQTDKNPHVGPVYGRTPMPFGMEIEGTRIEIAELGGTEKEKGKAAKKISGTAYFQKILLAAPPPQWYWGIFHFPDGSYATYMNSYLGRATLSDNMWGKPNLKRPTLGVSEDIFVYHKPSGRFFEGHSLKLVPSRAKERRCWKHSFSGGGKGFSVEGEAEGYAHSSWTFEKNIGKVPIKSKFVYNEYPSVMKRIKIIPTDGKPILLENGWGNMENSWGFII